MKPLRVAVHDYNIELISVVYADLELLTINTSTAAGRTSAGYLFPTVCSAVCVFTNPSRKYKQGKIT